MNRNRSGKIVYFAGAIRGDRAVAGAMREIVEFIKQLNIPVLSEHIVADDPIGTYVKQMGKTKNELTADDIERQDIAWLDQSTHVIAEISGASTGTGREIEYGHMKGKFGKVPAKVLCLYQKDREFFASPMIRGMDSDRYQNVVVRSYASLVEAKAIIKDFLQI